MRAHRRRGTGARGAGRRAAPLALFLLAAAPRPSARADDALLYRYQYYDESGGRIGVRTQGLTGSGDIDADTALAFTLMDDAIAGASPDGLPAPAGSSQVPLVHLSDHRKAWEADLSRQIRLLRLSLGISQSREHDYVSRGWSVNTLTDLNRKNTQILAGVAGHDDDVETFFDPGHAYEGKQAFTAILGVTQLLDPLTKVTLDVTWGRETGYLSDQYKLVEKTEELVAGSSFNLVFAENRPDERNLGVALASVNRAFPGAHGALEASARGYADTYGIVSGTGELRWIQNLGPALSLSPDVRLYRQGAADFYAYDLNDTPILPTAVPDPRGPAYSSDYRLSSLASASYGLKASLRLGAHVQLDLACERYAMRGLDGVTPQSAYPLANIFSAGGRVTW